MSDTGVMVDETVTTDKDGKFSLELLKGTYTVEEIEVPDRYVAPEPQTIRIEVGKTAEVSFNNRLKKGSIIIRKYDSKYPDKIISGAEFTVYQKNSKTEELTEYGKLSETSAGISPEGRTEGRPLENDTGRRGTP